MGAEERKGGQEVRRDQRVMIEWGVHEKIDKKMFHDLNWSVVY